MLRWYILMALLLGQGGCREQAPAREPALPPGSPTECLERMTRGARAGAWGEVFDLLGQDSRWSFISWHTSLREVCKLVRAHYPESRKPRALRRCADASEHAKPREYFAAGGGRLSPLDRLASLGKVTRKQGGDGRVTLYVVKDALEFCSGEDGWGFCGLREAYRQLKLKSARDLASVKENVEVYARQQ